MENSSFERWVSLYMWSILTYVLVKAKRNRKGKPPQKANNIDSKTVSYDPEKWSCDHHRGPDPQVGNRCPKWQSHSPLCGAATDSQREKAGNDSAASLVTQPAKVTADRGSLMIISRLLSPLIHPPIHICPPHREKVKKKGWRAQKVGVWQKRGGGCIVCI